MSTQKCPECEESVGEHVDLVQVPERLQNGPLSLPRELCNSCVYLLAYGRRITEPPGDSLVWSDPDRQSLNGKDIHCGATLEIYIGGGKWQRVRYEVEHHRPGPDGRRFTPVLHVRRPTDQEFSRERNELLALVEDSYTEGAELGVMRPAPEARFRWPTKEGFRW